MAEPGVPSPLCRRFVPWKRAGLVESTLDGVGLLLPSLAVQVWSPAPGRSTASHAVGEARPLVMLGGGQAGGAGGPGWGPENSLSGDQALPGAPTWAPTAARPARARATAHTRPLPSARRGRSQLRGSLFLRVRLVTAAPGHQGWGGLCAQTLRLRPMRSSWSLDCWSSG